MNRKRFLVAGLGLALLAGVLYAASIARSGDATSTSCACQAPAAQCQCCTCSPCNCSPCNCCQCQDCKCACCAGRACGSAKSSREAKSGCGGSRGSTTRPDAGGCGD